MYADLAASEPFTFAVGEARREFTIHSAIVAKQSQILHKIVHGPFLEGTTRKITWTHVEEATFICFWQYAYTGDYSIPDTDAAEKKSIGKGTAGDEQIVASTSTESPAMLTIDTPTAVRVYVSPESEPEPDPDDDPWVPAQGSKKKTKPAKILSKLERQWANFTLLRRQAETREASEPGPSDPGRTLLYHAKIYTLADCYGVLHLMTLSYNKLHEALISMKDEPTLTEFVELAQFCYESPAPHDLRQLIIAFTACQVEKLWLLDDFQALLAAHGELSKNVIDSLRARLA
ncbi:hypothetical protein NLG97_g3796 [Lecanicillium saksenae]|uniref:Uncharacterized protein n=1 Tax=Lecanicillium saksenae TaxID=468837 RepID=A0ACC1QX98_9HYPO|nr:hypothetical protein NLG97_g3796 [Lecanicillium saksenae]